MNVGILVFGNYEGNSVLCHQVRQMRGLLV